MDIIGIIRGHVRCVDVTLSCWSGRRQLAGATVKLGAEVVDTQNVTAPQAKLLAPAWAKRFSEIAGKKQRLLNQHAMPHMARGMAAVRATRLDTFLSDLNAIREELLTVKRLLIDAYDEQIVEWNRDQWKDLFEDHYDASEGRYVKGVRRLLPTPYELEKGIDLTWIILDIIPEAVELTSLHGSQLDALQATTKQMMEKHVNEFVDSLLVGPREQLRDAIQALGQQLADGTKITPATFNDLRISIGLLREFHDLPSLQDAELQNKIKELEVQIAMLSPRCGKDGKQLVSLDVSGQTKVNLLQAMTATAERCVDTTAISAVRASFLHEQGRHHRAIS